MSSALANSYTIAVTSAFGVKSSLRHPYSMFVSGGHDPAPIVRNFLINSLPDPSYKLTVPVVISVEEMKDGTIASFDAANIHMSGDTTNEAIENVLSLMLDIFEAYSANEAALGKEPRRQLDILQSYIQLLNAD
jgi:hypothetical protein